MKAINIKKYLLYELKNWNSVDLRLISNILFDFF